MRINDKYFPYPVIKEDVEDFNTTTYKINIFYEESDGNDLILKFEFVLDNEEIKELIKEKKAKFIVHVEESVTMFREVFEFSETSGKINIPEDKVRHKIELSSFIVAKTELPNFKSNDLNMIYNNIEINYNKFNIIGISQSNEILIQKESDEIKDVSSIFQIVKSEEERILKIRLANERIYIEMPNKDYERYNILTHRYRNINKNNSHLILLSLVIIPSFVEALSTIKTDYKAYQDAIWYNSLLKAFDKKNVDIEKMFETNDFNSYELTQIIFENVINDSIKILDEVGNNDL